MIRSNKAGYAAGLLLLLLAAFFSISLILQPLDFGAYGPGRGNLLFTLGRMLFSVYGFSSILIPLFLFAAAISCTADNWTTKRFVRLITAVIPFFTAVITENICKSILSLGSDSFTGIKLGITIALGVMLIVIEFLGTGIIADRIAYKFRKGQSQQEKAPESINEEFPIDENDRDNGDESPAEKKSGAGTAATEHEEEEQNPFEDIFKYAENKETEHDSDTSEKENDSANQTGPEDDSASNPASVITEEEYTALISRDKDKSDDTDEIEELDWPDIKIQTSRDAGDEEKQDAETDAYKDAEFIDSYTDTEQEKNPVPVKQEETDEEKDSLDPDFFDIDMNAETEDEKEEDEAEAVSTGSGDEKEEDYIALSHITPDTLTTIAAKTVPPEIKPVPAEPAPFTVATVVPTAVTVQSAAAAPLTTIAEDVFAEMDNDIRKNLRQKDKMLPEQTLVIEDRDGKAASSVKGETSKEELEKFFDAQEEEEITASAVPKITEQIDISQVKVPAERTQSVRKAPQIKGPYKIPANLLTAYEDDQYWIIDEETRNASIQLKETLNEFNIEADVTGIKKGPVVTMFEILPAPGVKLSKIVALQDNIALRLAASSVRIVAPIPGKRAVGIEIPNKERSIVSFREIVEQDLPEYKKMAVPVILGKDILGKPQLLDLVKTPHLLIAGATGSGKSVCVNSMILSILYKRSPQEVKLILIDPKIVELKLYNDIPHLLVPVITESKKAFQALQWSLCEMERRYALLDSMGCRDISSYNKRIEERHIAAEKLPYIVIIIDEFADLMATTGKELESTVARLAAMSRAVGLHLVLATQRPSIDVITGLIKANIPSRIAFMVASKMDSRIIIDQVGAEKLLGKGDMLYSSAVDPFPVRIQGTFVSDQEVENVVEYVKKFGEPEYIDEEVFVADDDDEVAEPGLFSDGEDPLYNQALEIVVQAGKASASYIQRRLKIGYNRAARLVEEMEDRGIVGPANGSKPREIIHVP
jgi:DNA segregation ATPase FtsK/SpoIIIE, S-DNA-T family